MEGMKYGKNNKNIYKYISFPFLNPCLDEEYRGARRQKGKRDPTLCLDGGFIIKGEDA